ncbi:MAG: hypothetical protein IPO65_12555 [Saprospiraceae bacterium]|nr:hypothetical protein [Saprospiraceae bacterium]
MIRFSNETLLPSATSVLIFGVYLSVVGLSVLLVPNLFLSIIGVENTDEVWIRLLGLLLTGLSVFYYVAVKHLLFVIFKVTVIIRCSILFFFAGFVYLRMMEPVILLIAGIDFVGGAWTYLAMKKEGHW